MLQNDKDVIVAVATAPGRGGVGIVRLSGAINLQPYLLGLLGREALEPRLASYRRFQDCAGESIDEGVALYFPTRVPLRVRMYLSFRAMVAPLYLIGWCNAVWN